ncbi:MAG: B12 binding domain protein [Lentisphaerae bacterium ADurb.Bin242]|nr:MAG: B12 binding domain protein [Lentisphaerae bacterium ADurb.Bin242]
MKPGKAIFQRTRKLRIRFIIPAFPTFNIYSSIAKYTTALGPVLIASVAAQKAGWDVEVIDENNFHGHAPKDSQGHPDHDYLQNLRPADVIGFYGGLSSTIPRLYELAEFYDARGTVNIAGGQHFVGENIAESLARHIDYLILGEGEQTISELMDALSGGTAVDEIKGLAYEKDGQLVTTEKRPPISIEGIVLLPVPDFSLLRHAKLSLYPVSWERGCCMHCEFCTVKSKVRCPAPDYLVTQITSLHERFHATNFFIVDDLFGQNRGFALEFCQKIKNYQDRLRVRFHFTVQIRLDKAGDQELLTAMRAAGIQVLAVGYESPIPEELKAMNKKLHPDDMIRNTKLFHRAGFLVHGMFIFGYPAMPGQDFQMSAKDRGEAFRKFIRKSGIDTIQILLPVPLPGTELTARLHEQRRIFSRQNIGWEYYDGNFQLFEPDAPLTALEMQEMAKKLMTHFYRWSSIVSICMSIFTFPTLIFFVSNLKKGWRGWFTRWRNSIWRFIGWRIICRWKNSRNQDTFREILWSAQDRLNLKQGRSESFHVPKTGL